MNYRQSVLCCLGLMLVSLAGCSSRNGPADNFDSTKYTIENTDKFVLLDPGNAIAVSCTGLQEAVLPDGRLQVAANVKNRENRLLRLQVSCVFKDEQGTPTGDETPYKTVIIESNATEAVQFTSLNTLARKYTVRVRETR
jgi:hypothetical protein